MSQAQTITGQQNTDRALDRLRRQFRDAIDAREAILQILKDAPDDANRLRVAEENFESVRRRLDREADLLSAFALEGATVTPEDIANLKAIFQRAMDDIERDLVIDDGGRLRETRTVREAIDTSENVLRETIIKVNQTEAAGVRARAETTQEEIDNLRTEQAELQSDVEAIRREPQLGLEGLQQLAAKQEQLRLITEALQSLEAAETGVQTPEQLNERRGAFIRRMTELRALFENAIAAGNLVDARKALADSQNETRAFAAFLAEAQEALVAAGLRDAFLDTFNREGETLGTLEEALRKAEGEPEPAPNGNQTFLNELERAIAAAVETLEAAEIEREIRNLFDRAKALGITDEEVASGILALIPQFPTPTDFSSVEAAILVQVIDRLVKEKEPLPTPTPEPPSEEDARQKAFNCTLDIALNNAISLGSATRAAIGVKDKQTAQENFSKWNDQLIQIGNLIVAETPLFVQQERLEGALALIEGAAALQADFQGEIDTLAQAGLGQICISEQIEVEGLPKTIQICAKPGIGLPDFDQTQFFREVREFQRKLERREDIPEPEPISDPDGFEEGQPEGFRRPPLAPTGGARP